MTQHHPAAFINAIAEARDISEAIKHLQQTWNELCEARQEIARLKDSLGASQELLVTSLHYPGNEYVDDTHRQVAANRQLLGPIVS